MSGDIEVQLLGELVGEIHGGERIEAFGELKARPIKEGSRVFEYFMDVNSIEVLDGSTTAVDVEDWEEEIDAIASAADPVQVLKDSFAPDIHRHGSLDDIIEAVLIQMAGATATDRFRSDIHVMLLGDPGTGKSKILKAAEDVHPRAKYKNGESVTAAGLTAAATKDDFGSTAWTLKPGLLVLTNGGMAILDEIDKASDDAVSSLHSVLERQTAAVSKAGIDAELPAATSLLAAGNPEGSRFDPGIEAIYMQIGFPASILSRFDLVFLIQDRPGGDADEDIARKIADSFVASTGRATGADVPSSSEPAYPPEALTAYLAYARDRVHPVVDDRSVLDPIVDTFRRKRADRDPDSPVPMTARFVDSMNRIAHASARLRLSEVVEPEDVDRAVRLVELSIDQTMTDTNGRPNPTGASTEPEDVTQMRREIKSVIKDAGSGGIRVPDFWEYFEYHGYSKAKVRDLVDRLENTGRLTKINGTFRLTHD
jgi:replicative DNA helicase Mcm